MGIATAGVGMTPSADAIGIAAPIIVIGLRILQGLALGGEYGGAAIYVAEHSPPGKRGFYTSFIQASVVGGFRSEEHTSELQSLMRNSYAAFCLKKNIINTANAMSKYIEK